jgi:hypothetical protein
MKEPRWKDLGRWVGLLAALFFAVPGYARHTGPPTVAHPINPAVNVPHPPPDESHCTTMAEDAMLLVTAVVDNCFERVSDKWTDYVWITSHALLGFWVPGMGEVILAELTSKLGKDATVCVLAGLVEGGGGTPEQKKVAKASVETMMEWYDRKKYYKKFNEAWKHFSEYGKDEILDKRSFAAFKEYAAKAGESESRAKFLEFLDKKTLDRWNKTDKEAELTGSVLELLKTSERKAQMASQEANRKIEVCDFEDANTLIANAQLHNMKALKELRQAQRVKEKAIRCQSEAIQEYLGSRTRNGVLPPVPNYMALQKMKMDEQLDQLKLRDGVLVATMGALADQAATVQANDRQLEAVRKQFKEVSKATHAAMKACDWQRAAATIDQTRMYTDVAWCASVLKREFIHTQELRNELQARIDKQANAERIIQEQYNKALAQRQCSGFLDAADFLEKATKGICVNAADAATKIASLREMGRNCLAVSTAGPPAIPRPVRGGRISFVRAEREAAGAAPWWTTIDDGMIVQHDASYGYTNSYSWTRRDDNEGITLDLVASTTPPAGGTLAGGINVTSEHFTVTPNFQPGSGAMLYLVAQNGIPVGAKGSVRLTPPRGLAPGTEISFHVSAAWGPSMKYIYRINQ